MIAPFNDAEFVREFLSQRGEHIAAVIVEPLQRIIPPVPGFLETLREECTKHNIVLIFDEVVTGFRFAYGGAQQLYGVVPDLCTLGKVIGGGFPLAAISGSSEIMAHFDLSKVGSDGFLMQVGTLSGNPVASVAGLKTMEILRREGVYEKLYTTGRTLMNAHSEHLTKAGVAHQILGHETLFDVAFTDSIVRDYRDLHQEDTELHKKFNSLLRQQGVFKSPSKTYVSLALTDSDINQTIDAIAFASKHLFAYS